MINSMRDTDYQIIIIGQQPWDIEIGSNAKSLALEFSKNHQVLYVNSPLDRFTSWKDRHLPSVRKRKDFIDRKEIGIEKIQDNLWNLYPDCLIESINWIGSTSVFNLVNRFNNVRFSKSIRKAIEVLGFNNYILFNDNEMFKGFFLNSLLNPKLSIYYSRDNMIGVPYWRKHGLKGEPQIIAKYDLCLANSTYLMEYCLKFNPNSFYVGQGCDVNFFKDAVGSKLFDTQFSGPVIGYVGALQSSRLDLELIAFIAKNRPKWTVILVGPEDDAFRNSPLHGIKNIIFTGRKPMDELADYINSFDICINPQLLNEITVGNYPRKIDEYLAMGKPVVAVTTKAMESFKDFVYLAESKDKYLELIEKALKEDNAVLQEGRVAHALSHTWENSVRKIYDAIEQTVLINK